MPLGHNAEQLVGGSMLWESATPRSVRWLEGKVFRGGFQTFFRCVGNYLGVEQGEGTKLVGTVVALDMTVSNWSGGWYSTAL